MKFIFDEIVSNLRENEEAYVEALSYGKPDSFEQYAEMVGTIAGIRHSIQSVEDVYRMMQKQEEDNN